MSEKEKQRKGIGNVLPYLILLVSVSSTVKVANVANYHRTIQSVI